MIFNFIKFRYFFISFAIGILYIYLTDDFNKVIIMYPTPENINKYTYVDKSNKCFNYKLKETTCHKDSIKINVDY